MSWYSIARVANVIKLFFGSSKNGKCRALPTSMQPMTYTAARESKEPGIENLSCLRHFTYVQPGRLQVKVLKPEIIIFSGLIFSL